jgi:hypothetical protein
VKDTISIELSNAHQELYYSIYNLNGQIIEQKKLEPSGLLNINMAGLSSGIYIINLIEKETEKSVFIRVIKE